MNMHRSNSDMANEIVGKRWTSVIIQSLMSGENRRFKEIMAEVPGISAVMLTRRIKELAEFGIVERHVYNHTPVLIEYELTDMGKALGYVLQKVENWANQWNVTSIQR